MPTTTGPSVTPPTRLQVEPRDTLELWDHLYDGITGFLSIFSGVRSGTRLQQTHEQFYAYPVARLNAFDWLVDEASQGREVYFCAHLLKQRKRQKEHAAQIACLWADGDGAIVPDGMPRPTAAVESSPGRHHYYWRLTRAIDPLKAEDLNHRLTYAIGADKGGWDLTQLLRPPGFPNFKYADTPSVRLVRPW